MPSIVSGFPTISPTEADTSITFSVVVPSGLTNPVMVVYTFHENAGGAVSGMTYNGDALSFIGSDNDATWSRVECWKRVAPDVGTFNLVATKASAGNNRWRVAVYILEDCDQTTVNRTPATLNGGSGTSASVTVGSVAATDLIIDQLDIDSTGHTAAPGANQTATYAVTNLGAGTNEGRGSSQAGSDGGVMSWSWTGSAPWSLIATAFIHDAGSGPQNVNPSGIASAEAFGTPTISPGPVNVSPTGIASAEAFGTVARVDQQVSPTGILSAEAFGTARLDQNVSPTGIPSAETFGTPSLVYNQNVSPTGIASAEAFGTPTLDQAGGTQNVTPTGIASAEAFGVIQRVDLVTNPTGIASAEVFGVPTMVATNTLNPTGIVSAEAFGTPRVDLFVNPTGIPSAEAFGVANTLADQQVFPTGIGSLEVFGTPTIDGGAAADPGFPTRLPMTGVGR